MKLPVVVFVVLVHAVLVLCLGLNSCSPGESHDQAAAEHAGAETKPISGPAKPQGQLSPETNPALATTEVFSPRYFQNGTLSVTPGLKNRLKDCRTGVLIDITNRRLLWNKSGNQTVPLASLTKMMTALMLVERQRSDPGLSLDQKVRVTKEAEAVGGSQVYLDHRESLTVDEILKCIMIFSANDAAYLAGQVLGNGSVDTFVRLMNQRSDELGLQKMRFLNPHGLPERGQDGENRGTALEVAYLAEQLLKYPEVVRWSSTRLSYLREKTGKPFQLLNRNQLVEKVPGVNGMKTGYTQKAGFCIATTCQRDGRTLVAVVTGCPSSKRRNALVRELLDWGYRPTNQT
jgi:D-alanyl-D-alanine carboxypeptidase (penicillin-binding protein 5/6)